MEYWKKLSEKYIKSTKGQTKEHILEWYEQWEIKSKHLLKHWGKSSWNIQDFVGLLYSEEVSESKFRELVRFEMEESFKKRVLDLKNKYKSQLSELKNRKLTKVMDEDKIKELEIKIKTLDEL